ncbi:MAG: ABC transporter ATP-binding protein [Firmicutes bacterium]|nr:ABC transporter ATP-binding protein [Bacillota bacterium]
MIDFCDVYKIYQMGDYAVHALDGVSLHIEEGEFVSIVGASGSGKSTCMNIIGCLDEPSYGQYILNGRDVSHLSSNELANIRNRMLGFVFQQYNLIAKLNVLENVELPLLYQGVSSAERHARACESLARVDLSDKLKNLPSQLSGGQQQRVSIARALVSQPKVILADEPTGALDSKTGQDVINLLRQLNQEGHTIVLITHEENLAVQAKRMVRLSDGKIVEQCVMENSASF